MSKETFQISYDGDVLRQGTMNVYDLAPALMSVGDLVRTANDLLNGESAQVSVFVESDFKKGSFEVSLLLDQTLLEQVKGLLPGHTALGAGAIVGLLFGAIEHGSDVVSSFLKLWKLLRGEKPKEVIKNESNGLSIIVTGDNNKITVTPMFCVSIRTRPLGNRPISF